MKELILSVNDSFKSIRNDSRIGFSDFNDESSVLINNNIIEQITDEKVAK